MYEIKRFDSTSMDLWKIRMCNILFLKERDHALESENPTTLTNLTWSNFNKKATTYIQRGGKHEILLNLKNCNTANPNTVHLEIFRGEFHGFCDLVW